MAKRILFFLGLIIISVGCAKVSEVENLQRQIDELKSDQIASINAQIAGITQSIGSLQMVDNELRGYIATLQEQKDALAQADRDLVASIEALRGELSEEISSAQANVLAQLDAYKATLTGQLSSINAAISALQAKDTELQQQITALQNYIHNDLITYIDTGDQGVKNWVATTFVTLEAFNATAEVITGIQGQIENINQQIAQLASQDDLIQAINSLDASLQEKIRQSVSDCNSAIASAKQEITSAYTKAIQNAISASENSMKSWVNNQLSGYYTIAQTDAKIASLKSSLEGQLNSQKTYLEGLISRLETRLTQAIDNNKNLIDGLQGQINGLSNSISELAGQVAANSRNISENATAIAVNARNISLNAADIDACEGLIAENRRLIGENSSAVSANAAAIAALQGRAADDERDIASNAASIAQNASDIASNAALIAANATAISNNARAISDNASDIAELRTDLATARAEVTSAYQQAISTAISTLDGKLSGQIATEVATINGRIDSEIAAINTTISALTERVSTCERDIHNIKNSIYGIQQDIEDIQEQIAAILSRIQSIAYVPKYSDGKAIVFYTDNDDLTPGTLTLDFKLLPALTASELVNVWQTALRVEAVYTITKAAPERVELTVTSAEAEDGYLTVTVSGNGLKEDFFRSRCGANATLIISDGNNELTSEYIQLIPWTTDVISFGDRVFKDYCVENFDADGDGEITEDEAKAVTAINVSMLDITSLAGIEYFSNLETLDASFNKLTSLDLSHSPGLKAVDVAGNKLQSLNLSGLSVLETLDASNNKLGMLDVSESPSLVTLHCSGNEIGALNLTKNRALKDLLCNNNHLQSLNLKNNVLLETLFCRKNEISTLDVSALSKLKDLDCSANRLTSLNLYNNPDLEILYCASNQLTVLGSANNGKLTFMDCHSNELSFLDISRNTFLETIDCAGNQLGRLDVSSNVAISNITCSGNPDLLLLWVKDASQEASITVSKDDFTTIAYNNGGINIPDANLKSYLVTNYDDDGDGEISILESENVNLINCSGKNIEDLTGLEVCTNLTYVNCANNSIKKIDFHTLRKLETLICYGNKLSEVNLNNCNALSSLFIMNVSTQAIQTVDSGRYINISGYSQADNLRLSVNGTSFYRINLTDSSVLKKLDLSDNQIVRIDAFNNTALTELRVNESVTHLFAYGCSAMTGIDVSRCANLGQLNLHDCALSFLDISNCPELYMLDAKNNTLSTLALTNNTKLVEIYLQYNNLSRLDISNCPALKVLDLGVNNLSSVNVRSNSLLERFSVARNSGITILDVSNNLELVKLHAEYTSLTAINLSQNTKLKELYINNTTQLTSLNLAKNTALTTLNVSGSAITSLDLSKNTALTTLDYKEGLVITTGFSVGRYIKANGKTGVTFYVSGKTTKIMSTDQASKTWGYSGTSTGATSTTDGVTNTNKIPGSPAAQWSQAKGSAWYLPARDELKTIYNNKSKLNTSLSAIGETQLGTGYYWSSTEYNSGNAYGVYFNNGGGDLSNYGKNNSWSVRAVRIL